MSIILGLLLLQGADKVDPVFVNMILQGGALAILGYHLLYGLPSILRESNRNTYETITLLNKGFDQRQEQMVMVLSEMMKGIMASHERRVISAIKNGNRHEPEG